MQGQLHLSLGQIQLEPHLPAALDKWSSKTFSNPASQEKAIGIYKMITKGKMLWSLNQFSWLILMEIYGDQSGELVCG